MSNDVTRVIVLRGGRVLARPKGDERGPIPFASEIEDSVVSIEKREFKDGLLLVTSSTGEPEGYRWVNPMDLQSELEPIDADELGELLLCA